MGDLMAIPAFEGIPVANVLSAVAHGSSRVAFVWLVGVVGLVGLVTGWNTARAVNRPV